MNTKPILFALLIAGFATPALASHCPTDVAKVDAALADDESGLTDDQLAEIKKLRDEGASLHEQGKHAESVEVLHEALDMLGVDHDS
jgi:hypothetical protein